MEELTREMLQALGAPFAPDELEFLPGATTQDGSRAIAMPYVEARAVMNRLDFVAGPANWGFDYELVLFQQGACAVKGTLTVCGAKRADAGEAKGDGELLKSAVSDALKRCAVHFNVARYLYFLPMTWAPYEKSRKRFTEPPQLKPGDVQDALRKCGVLSAPVAEKAAPVPEPPVRRAAAQGNVPGMTLEELHNQVLAMYREAGRTASNTAWKEFLSESTGEEIGAGKLTPSHLERAREVLAAEIDAQRLGRVAADATPERVADESLPEAPPARKRGQRETQDESPVPSAFR